MKEYFGSKGWLTRYAQAEDSRGMWQKYVDEVELNKVQDPSSMVQEPRNMYSQGQLVRNTVDGSRPGYKGLDEIKKITAKKYKDFVKDFKKNNNRVPSQFEIRTLIKGGGDWESIHKYLEEGKDFLTKSESMKIAQPAKQLISVMPKGMDQWLKNNEINVDWEGANNQERASLKKRFTNRNKPLVKSTGYVKKFESYIEDLIKKGNTGDRERSLPKLIKDSKSNISLGAAQKIITDKNFFVNKSSVDRVFPAMEKRAIKLLNQGLPSSEVTKILADEQIIKPRLGEKIGIRPFKNFYNKLLEGGKLKVDKIAETISGVQIPTVERNAIKETIFDYMKKNPDIDSSFDIAKAVSVDMDRKISSAFVRNVIERTGQDPDELFKTKSQKIFKDIKSLDKVIKKNKKLLNNSSISFAEKNRMFTKLYADATGKPLEIATGEFVTRLRNLGKLYTNQPKRFATELYSKIAPPLEYIDSNLHKNFVGLADAAGNLSVVDKAKLLGLPQKEIKILSELSGAVSKLGNFKMAGDHTDIDALMKNFSKYKKNYTRIEYIKDEINDFKGKKFDSKVMSLYNQAVKGQTHTLLDGKKVPIKEALKNLQTDFMDKTGHRLGGFEISETGTISIDPQTKRIPDLAHPINTKLTETLKGLEKYKLPGKKNIQITNVFDQEMMKASTVKDRINIFKKYKGTPELASSRFIKAMGSIPRLKKLTKPLIAGTIGAAGVTTLSQAGETGVVDKAKSWPIEHPWLTGGAATGATAATKKGRKLLGKIAGVGFGPTGIVGLNAALGVDPKNTADRIGLEAEAILAPSIVKGATDVTSKIKNPMFRKIAERASLGLMSPAMAMRAARIASPIGIASLGLEGLYHLGKKGVAEKRKLNAMTQQERDDYMRSEIDPLMDEGGMLFND